MHRHFDDFGGIWEIFRILSVGAGGVWIVCLSFWRRPCWYIFRVGRFGVVCTAFLQCQVLSTPLACASGSKVSP